MFVNFQNVGETDLSYETMLIAGNWGSTKIIHVLYPKIRCRHPYVIPLKFFFRDISGFRNQYPGRLPLVRVGLPFDSSFAARGRETAGILISSAKSSFLRKRCHPKAVPIFSHEGLGTPKPESACSRTPLLEFHTSFSIKEHFAHRTGHLVCPTKQVCRPMCRHVPDIIKMPLLGHGAPTCSSP